MPKSTRLQPLRSLVSLALALPLAATPMAARAQTGEAGAGLQVQPIDGADRSQACEEGPRVFEKTFNPSDNPVRSGDGDAPQTPIAAQSETHYDRTTRTRSLAPVPLEDGTSSGGARIIGGTPARPGDWPSAAFLLIEGERCGLKYSGVCGGTIIDGDWLLTAAHCLDSVSVDDKTKRMTGGLKFVKFAVVFEGNNQFKEARKIPVSQAIIHKDFDRRAMLNDVALLKLARPAKAPRQKLVASAGQQAFLTPGSPATVVGWGATAESGSGSQTLMQVTVPIVEQAACQASYDSNRIREVNFCAGLREGGKDSCQGDSGGPIFVASSVGEPVQAGVVSWGIGCARPEKYGVYANVGHFEQWIRQRVPNASFVAAKAPGGALGDIGGAGSNKPPAAHGQVTAEVYVLGGSDARPANRIKVGSKIAVRATSGVTGNLFVFNKNAMGEVRQIFPNRLSGGGQVGATTGKVQAGQTVSVPGPGDGFDFKLGPPHGRNEIIVVVAPDGANVADLATKHADMQPIGDFDAVLAEIASRTTRNVDVVPRARRGVGVRVYEIIP